MTLKAVAQHLGLTPGTVSAVLNDSPSARSIPQQTKLRIHAAAKELNYRPNFFARTLRNKRTYTIGVIAEEIGDSYGSLVISGIEEYLRKRDYFFLTVVHRHDQGLLNRYSQMLSERGVEGFITVDTTVNEEPSLPTVAVAGHKKVKGVTNIVLDHYRAASLALNHLAGLSHERIAFMKGNPVSSDSKDRWQASSRNTATSSADFCGSDYLEDKYSVSQKHYTNTAPCWFLDWNQNSGCYFDNTRCFHEQRYFQTLY